MKISLGWIQEFTSIDESVEQLAELIGSRLVEVEEIIDWGVRFEGVVVARITEKSEHVNADKLAVYHASIGMQTVQVVSGDKTLEAGDLVGYIPPGVAVPSTYDDPKPVVMEGRDLRGVHSEGMFGSARELLLGADHDKVQKLDTDAEPGTPLADAYNLRDIILDIENKSFTHRPDCFGILGLAREIAAIQGRTFHTPDWFAAAAAEFPEGNGKLRLKVTNQIPELAPRYMAVAIENVTIGPSSLMMQSMLLRMGVRPINNIVDITNYLMLLTGQPMHAFDYDKVYELQADKSRSLEIVIRQATELDQLELLDGRSIDVRPGAIVIATPEQPIALAGIMGGAKTEISDTTKNIIIESANFDMYNLRSTSMAHGVFTDALTRFAKGQSPSICEPVLAHALGLVYELSPGATQASKVIDDYAKPKAETQITTDLHEVNGLLGTNLTNGEMAQILRRVEFAVDIKPDESLAVTPPLWRSDIAIAEDLADEVGRLFGFDDIEPSLPHRTFMPVMPRTIEQLKTKIRTLLRDAGANEVLTYNFVSQKLMDQTSQDPQFAYRLVNSISPELAYMRTNLLGSLLTKIHPNHKAGFPEFALFEMNKTHNKEEVEGDQLPKERYSVALAYSAEDKVYDFAQRGAPFYIAKHYLTQMLHAHGVKHPEFRLLRPHTLDSIPPWLRHRVGMFDLNRSAIVLKDDMPLGVIGEPSAEVRRALKLPKAVAIFELDLEHLLAKQQSKPDYRSLLRFPASDQDICFKVTADRAYGDLILVVREFFAALPDIRFTITPVDIFQRENDTAHKQITIRLRLQREDRTMTTDEVNKLLDELSDKVHQFLRGERV